MIRVVGGDTFEEVVTRIRAFNIGAVVGHIFATGGPLPTARDEGSGFWRRFGTISFARSVKSPPTFGKRRHRRGWCAL